MRGKRVGVCLVVLVAASIALTACGRRGALQPPPGAGPAPLADEAAVPSDPLVSLPAPGAREPETVPVAQPDRPFLLDFLL